MRNALAALLATFLGGLCAAPAHASDLRQQVEAYRAAHEADIVGQLAALTRLPSVAARPQALIATADKLEHELQVRGFETAQFTAPGGGSPPVVFGVYRVHGATRTVVFYAHYYGQPVTPSQWASDPFVPLMRSGPLSPAAKTVDWQHAKAPFDPEWRFFGRAAADDKASIVAFLACGTASTRTPRRWRSSTGNVPPPLNS